MDPKKLEVSTEELNLFEYFLENDKLTSWSEWRNVEVKFNFLFPELLWYFRYTKKLATVKQFILMQLQAERRKRSWTKTNN